MSALTEDEWQKVQGTLTQGGLRSYIDLLLRVRANGTFLGASKDNQMLLYRAYDDGSGNTVTLSTLPGIPDYFEGLYDGEYIMEGTEIGGVLYCICPNSGLGAVSVLVGMELCDNTVGPQFDTIVEARAYIRGLTAR